MIEAHAERDLRAAPFPFRRQINQRIYKLKTAPKPAESEVLLGRIRWVPVHGWYIVYEVDGDTEVITVLAIL